MIAEIHDLSGTTGERVVHLPDTATALVFRTTAAGRTDLLVVGPRTRASYHTGKRLPVCLRARLRPGAAAPLLGVPVRALVDRVTPLADLWGAAGARLERRLAGLDGDPGLIRAHLEAAVRTRLSTQPAENLTQARLVRTAATALSAQRPARLPDLARALAVSERHLRDLFTEGSGLSPKAFARITRLRHALTAGRTHATRLAELATTTGYYDQSHMTAEFRRMLAVPPAAFFADRLPALQPC